MRLHQHWDSTSACRGSSSPRNSSPCYCLKTAVTTSSSRWYSSTSSLSFWSCSPSFSSQSCTQPATRWKFSTCWAKTVGGERAYWFRWSNSSKETSWDWSPSRRFSWCQSRSFMFSWAKPGLWHRLFIITSWHSVIHLVAIRTPETCSMSCD